MNTPVSLDRYSPPQAALKNETAATELASRGKRTLGLVIDSILGMLPGVPIYATQSLQEIAAATNGRPFAMYTEFGVLGWTAAALALGLSLVSWLLIASRGQSIGKLVVGSRIVRVDGSAAGFMHGVILRAWIFVGPALALSAIFPAALQLYGLFNLVNLGMGFFRADRRCIHDLVASTRVVNA